MPPASRTGKAWRSHLSCTRILVRHLPSPPLKTHENGDPRSGLVCDVTSLTCGGKKKNSVSLNSVLASWTERILLPRMSSSSRNRLTTQSTKSSNHVLKVRRDVVGHIRRNWNPQSRSATDEARSD